jgi:6-phosphogluconolactonase
MHIVPPEEFARAGAVVIEGQILAALEERRRKRHHLVNPDISLCLAGGSTPRPVYEALVANADPHFPWQSLHLWLGDERWVNEHDPESNVRMVREALINPAGIDNRSLRTLDAGYDDPDTVAFLYEKKLPARFDVMILGVGADCHTASIFPHSPAAAERKRKVVPALSPVPPVNRFTITLPVIARALRLVTLAAGRNKAAAVAAAIEGDVSCEECPARVARDGIWVLDTGAASALRST